MSTPESYKHLEELIELLRSDLRDAVAEIKHGLATRVDIAVYKADQLRIEQAIGQVREQIAEMREQRRREAGERRADRRIVAGAFITGGLSLLVALIVLALQILTG